jgi:hypothetical protein
VGPATIGVPLKMPEVSSRFHDDPSVETPRGTVFGLCLADGQVLGSRVHGTRVMHPSAGEGPDGTCR